MEVTLVLAVIAIIIIFSGIVYITITYIIPAFKTLTEQKTERISQPALITKDSSMELLKIEYEYAKETSLAAQQDRLTLVNYFITLTTAIAAGSITAFEFGTDSVMKYIAFGLFALSGIGFIFILQIVRLRQAWFESVIAMNKIKEYFIDRDETLLQYLYWSDTTIPKLEKFNTISFFSAFLISALSIIAFCAGLLVLQVPLILTVLLTILFAISAMASYYFMLKYNA